MQLKSLSYGHFPLNLLGMSAPATLGPARAAGTSAHVRRRIRVDPCLN
jgi:hypothetical protein